jgi:hypothetical protein
MLGAALAVVLPPRTVLFGESAVMSNLLYLFALSGIVRAIVATLLARRVRDLRKPRRELSAQALVMRVIGFNAMLGLIYDFIGRIPPAEAEDGEAKAGPAPPEAQIASSRARHGKTGDNAR